MSGKPYTWDDYHQGRQRQGSTGSQGSGRVQFASDEGGNDGRHVHPRSRGERDRSAADLRRRSSIGAAMNSISQVGGVNSIENFARSLQRAAAFHEIAPSRGSFLVATDDDLTDDGLHVPDVERTVKPRRSMLRQQIQQEGTPPESAIIEASIDQEDLLDPSMPLLGRSPSRGVFASPFSSSFTGQTYGSFSSRDDVEQRQQATKAFIHHAGHGIEGPEKDSEPLLIQQVEQPDGKISIQVIGQSTIYQTVLNSANVLIGVGILSLPLAIRYAGWIIGLAMLVIAALVTSYTARLLGKCLDVDRSMITYSDIALFSYGKVAEISIGLIFTFELLTASVALVVLFGDSLHLLVPTVGIIEFEIIAGFLSIPLAFVPLRYLGITSMLGVTSCCAIVVLVFAAGLSKPESPGSIIDPAVTYLFPEHWMTLPLSLGLLMSPWGGHAVFPQFYRDMRHPSKYGKAVTASFSITFVLDAAIAVIGLLMFGDKTRAEITSNILENKGYPRAISLLMIICIAIVPLTKLPLNARPVFSVVENIIGLREDPNETAHEQPERSHLGRKAAHIAIRVAVMALITGIAIVCPGFDRVMSLMGSLFCIVICICFPVAFYLKLYASEIGLVERIGLWIMGVVGLALAAVGTVWAFLPASITHATS